MKKFGKTILGLASAAFGVLIVTAPGQSGRASAGEAPKVYLTEAKTSSVAVIDTRSNVVRKRIPLPAGAHGLAMLPDGTRVFASSDEAAVITVISTSNDDVVGSIPTGKQPHGLIASRDGSRVYAAIFGDNQVLEINAATMKVERTFEAPAPHNIALDEKTHILYVADQLPGKTGIGRLDLASGTWAGLLATETVPRSLNLSPDGSILCVTQYDRNQVDVYSTHPLSKIAAVLVGNAPHHVVFTGDGKRLLTCTQGSNELTVIDRGTWKVVGTIPVGQKPHWIAPATRGDYAYVTDEASNQVTVVDVADLKVEQTIAVGIAPRKIVVQPGSIPGDKQTSTDTMNVHHALIKMEGPPPRFVPATLVVERGTTVEWVNDGTHVHTVTDEQGSWDSGSLRPGEHYARQFDRAGTYPYYCTPHRGMGMVGTIVVK